MEGETENDKERKTKRGARIVGRDAQERGSSPNVRGTSLSEVVVTSKITGGYKKKRKIKSWGEAHKQKSEENNWRSGFLEHGLMSATLSEEE